MSLGRYLTELLLPLSGSAETGSAGGSLTRRPKRSLAVSRPRQLGK